METKKIIPSTKTPFEVYAILFMMGFVLTVFISYFLGFKWGLIISFIILGGTTSFYTVNNIPMFHALILMGINGSMRIIFPGKMNLKLPWEQAQEGYIDLRIETSEVCNDTYPSKDALMKTQYVYSFRPDLREGPGRNIEGSIIKFSSFEISAIKGKAKALFSMLLSDHYAKTEGEKLTNKEDINKKLFGKKGSPSKAITEFEKEHGVEISVRLSDSDFDSNVQAYRDKVAGAKSINDIRNIFIKDDILDDGTVAKGVSPEAADQMIKLMEFDGYKETVLNLKIDAPDLKNLQNVNVLGGGGLLGGQEKKGGK